MMIETDRLYLREMTPDDLPTLRVILMDDEVMYAYNGAFAENEVRNWTA
jgi:RimJ/RimL family protein N-acetyltransferase